MNKPNIVLLMCDDLGYGDTGFNGNKVIQTPCLDQMRNDGARFTHFFAGGPVCSPTRGTCLTGRHYSRYGVNHANAGCLPTQEITLAKICKESGYRTGHFGKWHLGSMTTQVNDSNRGGPEHKEEFSPPWLHGFDTCFSSEAKVPTWDPMVTPDEKVNGRYIWGDPGSPFGTRYWDQDGNVIEDNLEGDDSRVIMDRAVPFVRDCAEKDLPFLAVIWFHAPHTPVVAGPEYKKLYSGYSEQEQHYYGCITAMDEQVGRLNNLLAELSISEDTMVWFCSDNGPEGREGILQFNRCKGSTGGLRGRKRSLFNGGVGVPALLKWPAMIKEGIEYSMPCSTLDYFPTIAETLNYIMPDNRPIDGISLLDLINGKCANRPKPIPYRFLEKKDAMFGSPTLAIIDNQFKFLTNLSEEGKEDLLFNIDDDIAETTNILNQEREKASTMKRFLNEFMASCKRSHSGADYNEEYSPINDFQDITGDWK